MCGYNLVEDAIFVLLCSVRHHSFCRYHQIYSKLSAAALLHHACASLEPLPSAFSLGHPLLLGTPTAVRLGATIKHLDAPVLLSDLWHDGGEHLSIFSLHQMLPK